MRYRFLLLFSCLLSFLLQSCGNSPRVDETRRWMQSNGKVKVLTTIGMIEDIVSKVGGERVDAHTLIQGDLDPHSYQLVKGDSEKLAFADLIFYNGLGLEHGPSLQSYLHDSKKATALGNKIEEENPELIIKIKGQTDPHIWMDISLWKRIVPHIVNVLSAYDPKNGEYYKENGQKTMQEMESANAEILSIMHSIPSEKRYLVTSHDAFNYFSRNYLVEGKEDSWQDRFAAPEGLAPESQLSASDIQEILDHVKKFKIHVLFPESNVSKDSIKKIVDAGREHGLELRVASMVLYADAMGPPGSDGDTYLKMVRHNAVVLAKNLMR